LEFLSDQDAKLVTLVPENEETFYVRTTYSPESADDTIKKSFTRYFAPGAGTFSTFGKLTAALGVVKTEEIKISDSSLVFRPYWRVKGVYACRYKRIHSHKLQLEDDVESVTIYAKDQYVVAERKRLSDLLASVGADFGIGYGPLRMSLSRLEGGLKKSISSVLRSGDRELGKKVELEIKEIVEIAAFSYSGAFLFDPNLNLETKDTFELLNKRDLQPVNETNLKGEGQVLEPTFLKSRVMEEVKDKLYKKPEEYPLK
jgi:hypothetical protein